MSLNCLIFFRSTYPIAEVCYLYSHQKGIEEVSKIKDGYNPATWMLEVTGPAQELALGVDFADIYRKSDLYKWVYRVVSNKHWDTKCIHFIVLLFFFEQKNYHKNDTH